MLILATPHSRLHGVRRTHLQLLARGAGIALLAASPASAQSTNGSIDRAQPYGSPLSRNSDRDEYEDRRDQPRDQNTAYPQSQRPGPTQIEDATPISSRSRALDDLLSQTAAPRSSNLPAAAPPPPNEFELFVQQRLGRPLPRFGSNLIAPAARSYAVPATVAVPPDYVLSPGDDIFIGLSGSIEASVTRQIDANGRVFLPNVGQISLGGVAYRDLKATIARAVGIRYRGFDVAVAVTRIGGVRVFVTGFANNPGTYTVDSLSTLVNAIFAAGGPSAGGSFRSARLIRNGDVVSDFDLYGFLRAGDRSKDAVLQNGDVVYIAPLGEQVALTGSVNQEGVYEARPGETLNDLLRFAGGTSALADADRLVLYRLANADTVGGVEVQRQSYAAQPVAGGDIVQILSKGTLARPLERQTVVVRIEGEVNRPGNYVVPPNTSLAEVLGMAGGSTTRAYLYGTNLQRVSVRRQQRESYEEALRQLEISLAGAPLTSDSVLSPAQSEAQQAASRTLIDRLRQAQPDGRMVMPIAPDGSGLPVDLALENNDTIVVPPRPNTVGVFGAVYRPASFLIGPGKSLSVRDYLRQAGGTLRLADKRDIFVVHANGAVVSRRAGALSQRVLPGDVVFVPTKTQNVSLLARIAQVSSILFQGVLGAATVAAVTR